MLVGDPSPPCAVPGGALSLAPEGGFHLSVSGEAVLGGPPDQTVCVRSSPLLSSLSLALHEAISPITLLDAQGRAWWGRQKVRKPNQRPGYEKGCRGHCSEFMKKLLMGENCFCLKKLDLLIITLLSCPHPPPYSSVGEKREQSILL